MVWWRLCGHSLRTTSRKLSQGRPRSVRPCPQQRRVNMCLFFSSLDLHVWYMPVQWGAWACYSHVDCLKARQCPSCPRGRLHCWRPFMSLHPTTEAGLKNQCQWQENPPTIPLVYSHETLAMNDPSGLERLQSLFHTHVHEDALHPSECKSSLIPRHTQDPSGCKLY